MRRLYFDCVYVIQIVSDKTLGVCRPELDEHCRLQCFCYLDLGSFEDSESLVRYPIIGQDHCVGLEGVGYFEDCIECLALTA